MSIHCSVLLMSLVSAFAQTLSFPGLPGPLEWKNTPARFERGENALTIEAGPKTDWYISPLDGETHSNAPLLLFEPAAEFVFTARITASLAHQWDAGTLMVYADERTWAKFALEVSAYGEPTIVTVVTRGVSDDCNSATISGKSIWFRVARIGPAIIFYSSADGSAWKLVRAFTFGNVSKLKVGFGAQSPIGPGGTATFSEIRYEARKIKDIFSADGQPPAASATRAGPLAHFLVKAKVGGYASGDETRIHKLDDGGLEIRFKEGPYAYRDRWYGDAAFSGEEVDWENGQPVWSMNYYGATAKGVEIPAEFPKFLKHALGKVTADAPYRGPARYSEGDLVYVNEVAGSLSNFRGTERILYRGHEIYRLHYHGGEIIRQ